MHLRMERKAKQKGDAAPDGWQMQKIRPFISEGNKDQERTNELGQEEEEEEGS